MQLDEDDVLFFYTDGCVDVANDAGDMFGSVRLEQLLRTVARRPAGETLARIEHDMAAFRGSREPFDDATMMVVNVG